MRQFVLLPLMALAACAPNARTAPAQISYAEWLKQHPDRTAETIDQTQRADVYALEKAGLGADYAAIRAAVEQHLPPADYTNRNFRADFTTLRRQRVEQTAIWLVRTGYGAVDVADPVRAARLVKLAAPPWDDDKLRAVELAPTVALAEFVEVVTEPGPPGTRRGSTVRYRILEPLKNAPPKGSLVRISGGPTINSDGTVGETVAQTEMRQPGRYVLYLSQRRVAALSGKSQAVDFYHSVFGPAREAGGEFVPVGESSLPPVTLDDLRAAVADQLVRDPSVLVSGEQARSPPLVADWEAIGRRVEEVTPRSQRAHLGLTAAEIRQNMVAQATNFLIGAGYRPEHLAAPQQARSLVGAATSGWSDADALVLASPIVFVADLAKVEERPDGSSDLVYRVTEPIKSDPVIGIEFRLPLISAARNGQPPLPPNAPMEELRREQRALFFGAPDPPVRGLGVSFSPMPVRGERVLPGYHSVTGETTLARIRATARAQKCSPGYRPVVSGINLPHKC